MSEVQALHFFSLLLLQVCVGVSVCVWVCVCGCSEALLVFCVCWRVAQGIYAGTRSPRTREFALELEPVSGRVESSRGTWNTSSVKGCSANQGPGLRRMLG